MSEALAGLAIASNIISIVHITGQLVGKGWECVRMLKEAPKELRAFMGELTSLHGVLLTLQDQVATSHFASQMAGFSVLDMLNQPDGALEACKSALVQAKHLLDSLQTTTLFSVVSALTKRRDIMTLRERIERLKTILILALHSDHL